jgi:hypothetical protein
MGGYKMVDFLDELLDGTTDDDDDDGTKGLPANQDDITKLKVEIEELNKEKHGLLQGVKAERTKRQEINGKLSQLTETVNGLLSNRDTAAQKTIAEASNANKAKGLPVTWTEDGEGFVDNKVIEEILDPYKNKILELEEQVQLTGKQATATTDAENVRRAIVGEDERYNTAYNKYQAARKWVVDQVTDFAKTNNIQRALTSGEALDNVFDNKDSESEFEAAFPGISLENVVTAEDSKRHFRNTMKGMADVLSPSEQNTPDAKLDSRFQKVLNKPSGLGDQANAKAGNLSVMDKLNSLSADDIMNIDDKTAEKLMQAIADDEKSGGVTF